MYDIFPFQNWSCFLYLTFSCIGTEKTYQYQNLMVWSDNWAHSHEWQSDCEKQKEMG